MPPKPNTPTPTMSNPVVLAVQGGFYFYGDETPAPAPGYITLKNAAMFGGFGGGRGVAGLCRGDKSSTATLDRFATDSLCTFPENAVLAILPSVDLYAHSGTTLR